MKKFIILLLIILAGIFSYKTIDNIKNKPASGPVVVKEVDEPKEEAVEPAEEPVESMEEPMDEPAEEVEEVEEFVPLKFKRLRDLKKKGAVKVKTPSTWVKLYDAKPSAYKIGGDVYFESKSKEFYVFHNGSIIKLN